MLEVADFTTGAAAVAASAKSWSLSSALPTDNSGLTHWERPIRGEQKFRNCLHFGCGNLFAVSRFGNSVFVGTIHHTSSFWSFLSSSFTRLKNCVELSKIMEEVSTPYGRKSQSLVYTRVGSQGRGKGQMNPYIR